MVNDPKSAFLAYVQAFEELDPETVLPFYQFPAMFIAPQGVVAAPDEGTARTLLTQFMGQLRAQSYRRTQVADLVVRRLSPSLALCSGLFVRFNASGQEISRLGFTYTLRSNAGSWQIVVALLHEPAAA
jgi:hypothetical protein